MKKCISSYLFVCSAVILGAILLSRLTTALSAVTAQAESGRTVLVIDPGHGGEDGGAVSLTGLYESHLNLEIALRLNDLLRFLGAETKMIRTEDVSVHTQGSTVAQRKVSDLRSRAQTVNQIPNALLISIHQNHFSQSRYRGAQVFYGPEGQALAQLMQERISTQLDSSNHRLCKAAEGVYLLEQVHCPAVLVECGFLSNPAEELLLRDAAYQKKLAAVLAGSVLAYMEDTNEV